MRIQVAVERLADGPIVGEGELGPFGVVEDGRFGAGRLSFEEPPPSVETHPALGADSDFRGGVGA
jgi:hypothetical protein